VRRIIQYCLLTLFVWQIVGFVGYFEFSHHCLKKEIKLLLKQGVPHEELVIFTFSSSEMDELIWLKKNEFDLDGNLFDVVRRHTKKDGTVYMECISDEKEKVLFANLGENISMNMGDEKHPTPVSSWMKILQFPALFGEVVDIKAVIYSFEEPTSSNFYYLPMYSEKSVLIGSPPPLLIG